MRYTGEQKFTKPGFSGVWFSPFLEGQRLFSLAFAGVGVSVPLLFIGVQS